MSRVVISSGSQISADAAIASQGGNAVDAAVAATLVSMCTDVGVMAPGASGFITIWPPEKPPIVIDAYAEMPGRGLPSELIGKAIKEVVFDHNGEWIPKSLGECASVCNREPDCAAYQIRKPDPGGPYRCRLLKGIGTLIPDQQYIHYTKFNVEDTQATPTEQLEEEEMQDGKK